MVAKTGFKLINLEPLVCSNLMDKFPHISLHFGRDDFFAVFDRPDDMIIDVVDRGTAMYEVIFLHTHSMAYMETLCNKYRNI